jgi:hypothetical protein
MMQWEEFSVVFHYFAERKALRLDRLAANCPYFGAVCTSEWFELGKTNEEKLS